MNNHPDFRAAVAAVSTIIIGVIVVIAAWVWNFHEADIASESKQWSEFGGYFGGTLAPILAFASFIGLVVGVQHQVKARWDEQSRANSTVYFKNATRSLERAFATFLDAEDTEVPVRDRLIWLTVARLICSAQSVSQKIEVESIREMYDAEEEFWRHRFYELLQPKSLRAHLVTRAYFPGSRIDEKSIRVIYEFTEWPQGRDDPIDGAELFG